jgi:phage terminase large subunit-like protein
MNDQEKLTRMRALKAELDIRGKQRKFYDYYPDEGPLRRELYKKHLAFFGAGVQFRERAAIAANRVGKTEGIGAYEMTCHLTGIYPDWWDANGGRRFKQPISAWAGGESNEAVRDIIQTKLLGPAGKEELYGTGMIPRDCLISYTRKSHIQNGVETIFVKHISGGISDLTLKSYEQGRRKWQGTEKHVVWLDEEPPQDIYEEALTRTMTVPGEEHGGMIMATFTPMMGLSEVTMGFMPGGEVPSLEEMTKFVCQIDWDDVPHLSEKAKKELLDSYHPHQREARTKGKPVRGSGVIYPVDEDSVKIKDFMIPAHWKRAFSLDVGWNCTAAAWLAINPETGMGIIYSCYKQGKAQPAVHAAAIKARGSWIPGCGDAAAVNQDDGSKMLILYQNEGLNLILADKAVETGIYDVWTALANGQLKVFASCAEWFKEFRLYRRDEKGNIVKKDDHLMDVTRYLERSGRNIAIQKPVVDMYLKSGSHQHSRPSAMCS